MVRFGRVEGVVRRIEGEPAMLALTVTLETNSRFTVVRDGRVPVLSGYAEGVDLAWHADQYTQETIGVELAEDGWEVIGAGEAPEVDGDLAASPRYVVRNLDG